MHRRGVLRRFAAAGAAGLGSLAGCVAPGARDRSTPQRVDSVAGVALPVPEDQLERGLPLSGIDAITDPAFGRDWSGIGWDADGEHRELALVDDEPVIGVAVDGTARAYPLRVLAVHEVVNESFPTRDGPLPLLVTYCPACASGIVARRLVDGEESIFGVSGFLWRTNLVLHDLATGSLWSQVAATAIRGPATGQRLDLVPASLSTWGEWRAAHPGTAVLRPPPASGTLYDSVDPDRVQYYAVEYFPWILDGGAPETGLTPSTPVLGISAAGRARAYPRPAVRAAGGVVNDAVGDRPVVVALAPGGTLAAYWRTLSGDVLEFSAGDGAEIRAGGSRFRIATGEAVDGPFAGRRLERASDSTGMVWRTWQDFHPETSVYSPE